MPARWNPPDPDAIVRQYRAGKSPDEIGALLGVSANPILRVLKEKGVPLRSRSTAEALKWKKRKLSPNAREATRRQCQAGWRAAATRKHTDAEVAQRARTIMLHRQTHGRPDPNEDRVAKDMAARGIKLVRQLAVHRYNLDLADPALKFAIEVQSHGINPDYVKTFTRRMQYLLARGWFVLVLDLVRGPDRAAIDYLAVGRRAAGCYMRHKAIPSRLRGRYAVVGRAGVVVDSFRRYLSHLPREEHP